MTSTVRCAERGCPVCLRVDPRHVDNLEAAGWRCIDHAKDAPSHGAGDTP